NDEQPSAALTVTASSIVLLEGWSLQDLSVATVTGSGDLVIPDVGTVTASFDFTINPFTLTAIDVTFTPTDPIAIGDTGFFLDSVEGEMSNINTSAPSLAATFDISLLPDALGVVP